MEVIKTYIVKENKENYTQLFETVSHDGFSRLISYFIIKHHPTGSCWTPVIEKISTEEALKLIAEK